MLLRVARVRQRGGVSEGDVVDSESEGISNESTVAVSGL